jgi:kinesin family protein 2/24
MYIGKTFTMMGGKAQAGLYMLAAQDIFARIDMLAAASGGESELGVSVSFFEIYGGKLFDLLSDRKPLVKREDGNTRFSKVTM